MFRIVEIPVLGKFDALIPQYLQDEGDVTAVYYNHSYKIIHAPIKSVMSTQIKNVKENQAYYHEYFSKILRHKHYLPILLDGEIYVSIKIRVPLISPDSASGYFNIHSIQNITRELIILNSDFSFFTNMLFATANSRVRDGLLVDSILQLGKEKAAFSQNIGNNILDFYMQNNKK